MPDHDVLGHALHGACGVLEEDLLLLRAHQAEELAGLGVVVGVILHGNPGSRHTRDRKVRFPVLGLLLPLAETVRLVADDGAGVAVHADLTVAVGGIYKAAGTVGPVSGGG